MMILIGMGQRERDGDGHRDRERDLRSSASTLFHEETIESVILTKVREKISVPPYLHFYLTLYLGH